MLCRLQWRRLLRAELLQRPRELRCGLAFKMRYAWIYHGSILFFGQYHHRVGMIGCSFHRILIIPQTALELNRVLNSSKKQSLFHHGFLVPGFRGLSPYSSGIRFHHHFLVPSGSGSGSGACLPRLLAFCSIIISWFHLVLGRVLGACLPILLAFCSIIISGLVALVFWHSVPSSCPGSFWFGRVPGLVSLFFRHSVPS